MSFQERQSAERGRGDVVRRNLETAMRDARMQQVQQDHDKFKQSLRSMFWSTPGLAVITGLLVMLILWLLNPPMVRVSGRSSLEKQQPSLPKIVAWGVVAGGVVALAPTVMRLLSNKNEVIL